jgi:dimeric dUTPase (all-alpha-NTP-PPase superfamily)
MQELPTKNSKNLYNLDMQEGYLRMQVLINFNGEDIGEKYLDDLKLNIEKQKNKSLPDMAISTA